jgi:hypothetical protein
LAWVSFFPGMGYHGVIDPRHFCYLARPDVKLFLRVDGPQIFFLFVKNTSTKYKLFSNFLIILFIL